MQPPRDLLHPPLQRAILPPHQDLAKVHDTPRPLALLFELPEVAADLAVRAGGVVDNDEVLERGDGGLLDVARRGVREGGEGGSERADVCRGAEPRDEEEVFDLDEIQGAYLWRSDISAQGTRCIDGLCPVVNV